MSHLGYSRRLGGSQLGLQLRDLADPRSQAASSHFDPVSGPLRCDTRSRSPSIITLREADPCPISTSRRILNCATLVRCVAEARHLFAIFNEVRTDATSHDHWRMDGLFARSKTTTNRIRPDAEMAPSSRDRSRYWGKAKK